MFNEYATDENEAEQQRTLLDILELFLRALSHATNGPKGGLGPDPGEAQRYIDLCLNPIVTTDLGGLPDVPRDDMFKLLDDPLGSATRAVRRNLVAASAVSAFVSIGAKLPRKVPGFDLDLDSSGRLVLVSLGAIVLWEMISFWSYVDNDTKRLRIADEGVRQVGASVRHSLQMMHRRASILEGASEPVRQEAALQIDVLTTVGSKFATRFESEARSVRVRRFLDARAPFALGLLALVLLVGRALCVFPVASFGWVDPQCR